MREDTLKILLTFISILLILFVIGILLFVKQYRRRKILYENEKVKLEEKHHFELLNTQLESQQQTMRYIGEEIHDNVGQKLTLASLYSRQLIQPEMTEAQRNKAIAISKIIDDSLTELRKLSKTLTDPHLSSGDIIAQLRVEARQVAASGACILVVDTNEEAINMPHPKENILFRLLQEFIQNSLKHSGCRRIFIQLRKDANDLYVYASDDGRGFDPEQESSGIGLHNMKQRAQQLNARYEFFSQPGKGVSLSLHLKPDS